MCYHLFLIIESPCWEHNCNTYWASWHLSTVSRSVSVCECKCCLFCGANWYETFLNWVRLYVHIRSVDPCHLNLIVLFANMLDLILKFSYLRLHFFICLKFCSHGILVLYRWPKKVVKPVEVESESKSLKKNLKHRTGITSRVEKKSNTVVAGRCGRLKSQ